MKPMFAAMACLGLMGYSLTAWGLQGATPAVEGSCGPGVTVKQCELAKVAALSKKIGQAAACARKQQAGTANTPLYEYMSAIQTAVTRNCLIPDGLPQATCRVDVVQLPGGRVLNATSDASCPYDANGRRSVENAVLRTWTLPYRGYESVFQRHITLTFVPPKPAASAGKPDGGG